MKFNNWLLSFLLDAAVAIHRHPSLITLRSASDDPSGGRRPAQYLQLDTPPALKESHNSIHSHQDTFTGIKGACMLHNETIMPAPTVCHRPYPVRSYERTDCTAVSRLPSHQLWPIQTCPVGNIVHSLSSLPAWPASPRHENQSDVILQGWVACDMTKLP